MSSEGRRHNVDYKGEGHDEQKKEVMNTLKEEMGISQEDIDFLYATFGEKCLMSVEKFFEYKDIQEKKKPREQGESVHSPPYAEEKVEASGYQSASGNDFRGGTGRETEVKEVTVIDDEDVEKWLVVEKGEEIKEHIAKYGLKNIRDVLARNLNGWKEKPLNIAVTGMAGKGKSSLINAFRNMEEDEQGAAEVGEEECTIKCRPYPHPEHENFVFWDVPGAERFSEIDSWLANEIRKRNKRFYFVRTKIDQDMANVQRRQKENFQEKKEFESLKLTIRQKLTKELGSSQFHFFMMSNHHLNKYDFPFLLHQLLIDVPNEKKLAMVFGIAGMSKNIIEEKASALRSRIWKFA